jgi:pSer/pThr/pTyr-binding forkhead associated (FHA) protein
MDQKGNKNARLTDAQGRSLELSTQGTTRLGRAPDNDLVLTDSTVSQHHAEIGFDNGRAFLRDLGSSNGTFVEGSRVNGVRLSDGSRIRLGQVELVYREGAGAHSVLPPVSPPRDLARTPPQNSLFSARTGTILGVLFLLGLVGTLAGRALFSPARSSVGFSGIATLVEGQNYRLPNASSDFVGEWCGWTHIVSCEPAGSCDEESAPDAMSFTSDAGGVLMQYSLMAPADTQIGNINVNVVDSRHVRVTSLGRRTNSSGAEILVNDRDDIVSVNSGVVQDSDYSTFTVNGASVASREHSAELRKCTDEFQVSAQRYYEQHKLVNRGEVTGRVPK